MHFILNRIPSKAPLKPYVSFSPFILWFTISVIALIIGKAIRGEEFVIANSTTLNLVWGAVVSCFCLLLVYILETPSCIENTEARKNINSKILYISSVFSDAAYAALAFCIAGEIFKNEWRESLLWFAGSVTFWALMNYSYSQALSQNKTGFQKVITGAASLLFMALTITFLLRFKFLGHY